MCSSYESGVVEIANLFKVLLLGVCRLRLAAFVRILTKERYCNFIKENYCALNLTLHACDIFEITYYNLWEVLLQRWLANEDMFLLLQKTFFLNN